MTAQDDEKRLRALRLRIALDIVDKYPLSERRIVNYEIGDIDPEEECALNVLVSLVILDPSIGKVIGCYFSAARGELNHEC